VDELGSLLQIEELVEKELRHLKEVYEARMQPGGQINFLTSTAVQGRLPLSVDSYEEWKERTLDRLKDHFTKEALTADLGQAFFSRSVGKGLKIMKLLSKRYDIIAANPPYLGKDKAGKMVAQCLENYLGHPDLYGAFFDKGLHLLVPNGRLAFLSLTTFMHLKDFKNFRENLLRNYLISLLVHLSNKSFESLSNPNAFYFALTVLTKSSPCNDDKFIVIDLDGTAFSEKNDLLKECVNCRDMHPKRVHESSQLAFVKIPNAPIAFKLPLWGNAAYEKGVLISDVAVTRQGLITGENNRFLRYRWEVSLGQRWFRYAKGGEFRRWFGNDDWCVDWEYDGTRIRNFRTPQGKLRSRPQNVDFFFKDGCSWSSQTISAFGIRRLENESVFDVTGSSVFPIDQKVSTEELLALLNTPAFGELFSAIQPGVHYGEGYLSDLPFVKPHEREQICNSVQLCITYQKKLLQLNPVSEQFLPSFGGNTSIREFASRKVKERLLNECELHSYECKIWEDCEAQLGIPFHERTVTRRYGNESPNQKLSLIAKKITKLVASTRTKPTAETWRATQTQVEEIATYLKIHPIDLKKILISSDFESALSTSKVLSPILCNIVTSYVLALLGHRWPRQVVAVEHFLESIDSEGVITLTICSGKPLLQNLFRDCILAHFNNGEETYIEREFEEVLGMPINRWLETSFFSHHNIQFKKRPIAWQLQSGRFTNKLKPAFACLVYYHRLNPDTLPKIRSQYTGPLRQRLETELRGIEGIPADARSARQDKRRVELERLIEEFQNFDTKLKEVTEHGFGPNHLTPQLRQYAIDDAMLCLKAQWLKRLSSVVQKGPLAEWDALAQKAELHQDLPNWIAEPIENLDHFCLRVGPDAPKAKDLKTDPVSKDLAAIICPHADKMIKDSLRLVCESWWKKLDDAIFSPLRSRIRESQEKIKSLKGDIAEIGPKSPDLLFKLEIQIEELKGNTKVLKKELSDKTEKAKKIREEIEGWTCHDASTWEPWLAAQPMYDLISSLDGQRKPPESVQDFIRQESYYAPDINDGVRVNIAPIQKAGLLAADVLAKKDVDKAIADRAEWRADERRWCREGKLPQPGWWTQKSEDDDEKK